MRRSACAPNSLISTFVSRTKHETFCRASSGPKLSAKLVCQSLLGGGGVPPRSHPGSGTANSISSRQMDRVMVHGHVWDQRSRLSEPLNGVSLACQWWPNVECWLGSFENFRGSGPVLLRNSIFLWFFQVGGGGSGTLSPPLDPRMGPDYVYTYWDIYWKPILSCASAFVRRFAYFLSIDK